MADTGSVKKSKFMLIGGHSRLNSTDSITISTDGNLLEKVKSSVSYIAICLVVYSCSLFLSFLYFSPIDGSFVNTACLFNLFLPVIRQLPQQGHPTSILGIYLFERRLEI